MGLVNASHTNSFQAPQEGVQGNRVSQQIPLPRVPFSQLPQNDSTFPGSEKSEKNLEIQVSPTQQEGLLVKQGEYRPEYGPQMYAWFASKEKATITYDSYVWRTGEVSEKKRVVPNPPPHFSEFARSIGVTWATLKRWKKANPEFSEYYDACVDIIQEFIVDNGLTGAYVGQFGIFAAKNLTKMKDVVVNKNENWDMKSVLDAIEKGVDPHESHDI